MSGTFGLNARRSLRSALKAATAAVVVAPLLAACSSVGQPAAPAVSSAEANSFASSYPPRLQRLYRQVALQGSRNLALNHMRSGLAALDAGHLDVAARSFDAALTVIDAIYADNPEAERARSLWAKESAKDFKGEPYERAMAHYYRGLVYMMQGDYQNARASFKGGLLQDTFMEENQRMAADFGALSFLEGWAARCGGADDATVRASFDEARRRNPALGDPSVDQNVLFIFETGSAPQKVAMGRRNEMLAYQPGVVPPLPPVQMNYGGEARSAVVAEDILFQAATRAGRAVDAVNQGKVVYQDTTQVAGRVATTAGAGLIVASTQMRNQRDAGNMAIAGGVALLVGIAVQAAADSMQTEADWRQWDNLPGNIQFGTFSRPVAAASAPTRAGRAATAAPASAPSEAYASFGRGAGPSTRTIPVRTAGSCSLAWGREIPADRIPDTAPNTMTSAR